MSQQGFIVRLRGLPWATRKEEIVRFLTECNIADGEEGVHFTYSREGRPSGEAFVELASEEDITNALAQNNEHIGSRYIEVFRVDKSEMDWMIKRAGANAARNLTMPDAVVKLRGLPFGCSKEEIAQFFSGMEIVPNGIMLPEDRPGRGTGEAFVQFSTPEIAERALEKHKERIGHRYIEIFKSSMGEANASGGGRGGIRPLMGAPRPCPYDRGDRFGMGMGPMMGMGGYGRGRGRNLKGFYEEDYDDYGFAGGMGFGGMRNRRGGGGGGGMSPMRGGRGGGGGGGMGMVDRNNMQPGSCYVSKTGHSVHMRGLPFQALEQDVFDFFSPIQPVRCEFDFGPNGRPSGEANVDFATHQEAVEAMKKHKCNMQHRYIELFLNSEPISRNSGGGGGGGGYGNGNGMGGGFGGSNMGGNDFNDDMGSGFNQSNVANGPFGGGYGGNNQGFGQNQGNFGNQGGFGNGGFGGQGMNNYDMGGGGYGDGIGNGGGMMGNNYTAF